MSCPILICDDSKMARRQVFRSLPEAWEVDCEFAENGKVAVDILRQKQKACLFLDLTMPEMDGVDVLRTIKEENIDVFVIVISADSQPEMRERVMSLGAVEFIKKPVDSNKLGVVLKKYGFI